MALSRIRTVRSILRVSASHPVAVGGCCSSLLQEGNFGSQLRNRFVTRDPEPSEVRDGGVLFWMSRHVASFVGTKLQSNMVSFGQEACAKRTLTGAVTESLRNGGEYQPFRPLSSIRGHHPYPFAASWNLTAAGNRGPGTQQARTIMVEVKKNDLDRAIRRWRRKCKEENLRVLKDREYYIKPSEKRILALKERDHRLAKRAFKQKLKWIMSRRQRGF